MNYIKFTLHNIKVLEWMRIYTSPEHNVSDDITHVSAFMPYKPLLINAWLSPKTLSKTKSKRINIAHLKKMDILG